MNKKNATVSLSLFLMLFALLFFPSVAFANGYAIGGGGGGAAVSGHYFFFGWDRQGSVNATSKNYNLGETCGDNGCKGSNPGTINTPLIAYLVDRGHCNRWVGSYTGDGSHFDSWHIDACGNYCEMEKSDFPSELLKAKYNDKKKAIKYVGTDWSYNGYLGYRCGRLVERDTDRPVTALWLNRKTTKKKEKDYTELVLIKATSSAMSPSTIKDNTNSTLSLSSNEYGSSHAKWVYYHDGRQATYRDTTEVGEGLNSTYKNKITAYFEKARCDHTWEIEEWEDEDGNTHTRKVPGSDKYTYSIIKTKSDESTVTYNVEQPSIVQDYYRPYNLQTNTLVKSEDGTGLTSKFVKSKQKIGVDINNYRDSSENASNSKIRSLDINADTRFKFNFNDNSFGMGDIFNWNNSVDLPNIKLANGNYELTNFSKSYCNGRSDLADYDGIFRDNLKFIYGVSKINSGLPATSSLVIPKNINSYQEILGGTLKNDKYNGVDSYRYNGGDFSTRFTLYGAYNLISNSSNYANWWVNRYRMTRFFEYGISYKGIISDGVIEEPELVGEAYCDVDEDGFGFTTITDDEDRGLYIESTSKTFDQPVLWGGFEVKTLAGDVI